jgi:hypothetical protein
MPSNGRPLEEEDDLFHFMHGPPVFLKKSLLDEAHNSDHQGPTTIQI